VTRSEKLRCQKRYNVSFLVGNNVGKCQNIKMFQCQQSFLAFQCQNSSETWKQHWNSIRCATSEK
jgi:hypothetical protein